MEMGEGEGPLRLGTIEISDTGIAELTTQGHRTVFVPRAGIERLTVHHGFTCERPLAAAIGAAVLLTIAGAFTWTTVMALDRTGYYSGKLLLAVAFPGLLGAALLWTLVRRGRYLRIDTDRGPRKLQLAGAPTESLHELLRLGRSRFGYPVDLSSLDLR